MTDDDRSGWEYGREVLESIGILIEGESSRKNHSKQSDVTIFMVPETLRNLNPGAYTPRITSIGPLHKEDKRLKAMEELKVTYMYRLFCETVKSTNKDMEQTKRTCVKEVFRNIEHARDCYAPSFTKINNFKLAEMMVIDGCFILELLYRSEHGIMVGDPIFDNILVKRDVKYDLLLLENQIPFFILERLFQVTVKHILEVNSLSFLPDHSLTDLIFCFFDDMNILNSELTLENRTVKHCHILGFLQSCYRPRATKLGQVPTNIIYSATEIAGAGVTFKPQRNDGSQLAVKFKQSPLVPCFGKLFIREASFEIPVLCIKDSTPSFLRNLIAYTQCYPLSRHYVTSFAFLMDKLIDTKDDVSLLVKANVLKHNLGAREDITNLFNNICNAVVLRDFYYADEWKKLDAYCKRFWPRILISLSHLYKSTTWKTLTVIAAMAIFALTLLQTINDVRNP
uniref:UPF0481 protein At3g47200-like n=1 Tax=Erigeron canadensis TaxID=72917 RepID=UPI001CB91CE1|nr:UPF0481 protein At3g47200-like [Erigeron canadensis]